MATTRPITTFFQPVKSSEIKNETVNGVEAEAGAMEFENGERCFMLLFHFLGNVTDCGLDKMHICAFVVLVELSDFDAEVLVEGPVSIGVMEGKYCIAIRLFFG